MVDSVNKNRGFLPSVPLGPSRPAHDLRAPAEANGPDGRQGPSKQQQPASPVEAGTGGPKIGPRSMRHEWKLQGGRAGAKQESPSTPTTDFSAARDKLQQALTRLKDRPRSRALQEAAHDAHTELAQQPVPLGHRSAAVAHKALRIGVAGSLQTFGVGRTLGLHAGTSAVPVDSTPGPKNIQRGVAQLGLGAVGGAIGNLVGQTVVAPIVDSSPRKFEPVDPQAILPDRMVAKMNRIRSGWGDEVRASIVNQQKEITQLNSDTNIHFGEKAFTAATIARTLLQPSSFKPNLPQSVAISGAVSTVAGGAVGIHMGVNMARSSVRIPRGETLDRVLASKPRERNEDAAMNDAQSLPLFYSHLTPADQRPSIGQAITDSWHRGDLREPAPTPWDPSERLVPRDKGMRMQNMGADLRNIGQSVAHRSGHLIHATAAPVAIATSQPFVVSAMPNDFSARAAGLVLPALAMKLVIMPWFNALAGVIPRHDAAMRAERQQAVDSAQNAATKPKTPT